MTTQDTTQNCLGQAPELDIGSDLACFLRELVERADGITWIECRRLGLNVRLHLAVRELRERDGLKILTSLERAETDGGREVSAVRYRLTQEDRAKARRLLGLPPVALPVMTPALKFWKRSYSWVRR